MTAWSCPHSRCNHRVLKRGNRPRKKRLPPCHPERPHRMLTPRRRHLPRTTFHRLIRLLGTRAHPIRRLHIPAPRTPTRRTQQHSPQWPMRQDQGNHGSPGFHRRDSNLPIRPRRSVLAFLRRPYRPEVNRRPPSEPTHSGPVHSRLSRRLVPNRRR